MTFLVAVAAGDGSAGSLEAHCATGVERRELSLVRHEDLVVVHAAGSRWVDAHDDDDVLVVLDGRLHSLGSEPGGQAAWLHARYRSCGTDVARGLLGDFVLVVLDRARHTLLVARDPLGVRPWYQAGAGRHHAGASDLATLASLPWVGTAPDERIAIEYLAAATESLGPTLYRSIRTLRPGRTWHVRRGDVGTFAHHRWELRPELDISWPDAAERCRSVLGQVVRDRLDPEGPVTCELSGGLDSSAVVGTVVLLGRPDDLTVGRLLFDTPRADERIYSDAVIDHWGLEAVSSPPWIPTEEECRELTRALRRPMPDPHFTMFAGLHRRLLERRQHYSLTGLGGDDAFVTCGIGGRVVSGFKLRQRAVVRDLARSVGRNPRRAWTGLLKPTLHHLAPWRGDRLPGWVSSDAAARAELPRLFRRRPERVTRVDAIDERIANLTSGYDACILETRAVLTDWFDRRESHPYLDPRFVEATYGLDPWWPTRDGHTRALEVEAFADRLPPLVARRQDKADFPEVFWPQLLDREVLARIRTGPLAELGWLDRAGFEDLVANAKEGKADAAIPLSRCASLDRWLRTQ